ncbi:MAG TPA: nucleotidyltransferase family protein [Ktedonobacterales bacterium]|nr:nucleotidyltransferase family protein [Ktedonobacterales bacterium]
MPVTTPVTLIVLAAGRSSRMGAHKLLLPIGGRPLITCALNAAVASTAAEIIVVLGHDAATVRRALPAGRWRVVECAEYASGMSASLRAGVRAVSAQTVGAIVTLADQPLVTAGHLDALLSLAASAQDRIVATHWAGRDSTPVYFPRVLFDELQRITGDEGGRSVIARHPELLLRVPAGDADMLLDVDDPASLERARALLSAEDKGD